MVSLGGGSYSGTIFTSLLETQTTGSLGYLGRTIWVDVPLLGVKNNINKIRCLC
jgi:hypothetical protein